MLVIGVIALLVFGPGKLPELGRRVGRAMREFRRASDEFRQTVETNLQINEPDPIIQPPVAPAADTPAAEPGSALASEAEGTAAFETPLAVATEPAEPFCAQRGARLFHRSDCAWVARIPEGERAWFKHVADAKDQGFLPCPACEPWEAS
ncbi:MAG: twin-arginine translocase TatA/TatE family subunit [Candidatus Rokubacteria bacterium]|nr:twin-arginine translocase TatA/TatE family subunit [Candidatus Rokubacteria bacterium]